MPFRKFANRSRKQDMMLLSGWLFADLLLGLMTIFLASMPPHTPVQPKLIVDPTELSLNDKQHCSWEHNAPTCQIKLSVSGGPVNWTPQSDMTDKNDSSTAVKFDPPGGTLSPDQPPITITISNFPCQNGSFTFNGPATYGSPPPMPAVIEWQCRPTQVKLEADVQHFFIYNVDVAGLLSNSPQAIEYIKTKLRSEPLLQNRSVGLAIVYGGTEPDNNQTQAIHIAHAIYSIMQSMQNDLTFTAFQRASYYTDLFYLGRNSSIVTIDIYRYQQ